MGDGLKPGEWGTQGGMPSIAWWRRGVAARGEPSIVQVVRTYASEGERFEAHQRGVAVASPPEEAAGTPGHLQEGTPLQASRDGGITAEDRLIALEIAYQAELDALEQAERAGNGAAASINRQRLQVAQDRISAWKERKLMKLATGEWMHLFGVGSTETRCRIVIDVTKPELIAAQEWTGLKFEDIRGDRLADLAESVIAVNEAHTDLDGWNAELTAEVPAWANQPQPVPRLSQVQQAALAALQSTLSLATECGLFDEMAGHVHPDRINAFCDDVSVFAGAEALADKIHSGQTSVTSFPSDFTALISSVLNPDKSSSNAEGSVLAHQKPQGTDFKIFLTLHSSCGAVGQGLLDAGANMVWSSDNVHGETVQAVLSRCDAKTMAVVETMRMDGDEWREFEDANGAATLMANVANGLSLSAALNQEPTSTSETALKNYRVIGAHPNGNFFSIMAEAQSGFHAFGVAALLLKEADEDGDAEFFASIPAETNFDFPGDSVVTLETVLDPEQADVFGLAEPEAGEGGPSPGM